MLEQQQPRRGSSSDQGKLSVSPAAGTNIPPTPRPHADVKATTAANTAANIQASSKALYYKTIARKCFDRMKQQKEFYELQLTGLRKQLEFKSNGSINMTNLSFASTVVGGPSPSPARQPRRLFPRFWHAGFRAAGDTSRGDDEHLTVRPGSAHFLRSHREVAIPHRPER